MATETAERWVREAIQESAKGGVAHIGINQVSMGSLDHWAERPLVDNWYLVAYWSTSTGKTISAVLAQPGCEPAELAKALNEFGRPDLENHPNRGFQTAGRVLVNSSGGLVVVYIDEKPAADLSGMPSSYVVSYRAPSTKAVWIGKQGWRIKNLCLVTGHAVELRPAVRGKRQTSNHYIALVCDESLRSHQGFIGTCDDFLYFTSVAEAQDWKAQFADFIEKAKRAGGKLRNPFTGRTEWID